MSLKLDLHVHSRFSPDGISSWSTILDQAEKRGLDGVSITDHDYFDRDQFQSAQEETDLILIPGQEVSTELDHILAYFIDSPVEPWRDPADVIDDIHKQGGIAVAAHPYRLVKSYPAEYFERFDAIEVFNGRSGDPAVSGTPNYYAKNLADELGTTSTAGSDSHLHWTIGNGVTYLESENNRDSIRENLLKGNTWTQGNSSLQTNRALSQFIRLIKEPSLEAGLKWGPRFMRHVGKDLFGSG